MMIRIRISGTYSTPRAKRKNTHEFLLDNRASWGSKWNRNVAFNICSSAQDHVNAIDCVDNAMMADLMARAFNHFAIVCGRYIRIVYMKEIGKRHQIQADATTLNEGDPFNLQVNYKRSLKMKKFKHMRTRFRAGKPSKAQKSETPISRSFRSSSDNIGLLSNDFKLKFADTFEKPSLPTY